MPTQFIRNFTTFGVSRHKSLKSQASTRSVIDLIVAHTQLGATLCTVTSLDQVAQHCLCIVWNLKQPGIWSGKMDDFFTRDAKRHVVLRVTAAAARQRARLPFRKTVHAAVFIVAPNKLRLAATLALCVSLGGQTLHVPL